VQFGWGQVKSSAAVDKRKIQVSTRGWHADPVTEGMLIVRRDRVSVRGGSHNRTEVVCCCSNLENN